MKLQVIIVMLIVSFFQQLCASSNNATTGQIPTINITVHTANRADLNQTNDLNQHADHHATQKSHVTTKVTSDSDLQRDLYDFLEKQAHAAHDRSLDVYSWMKNNIVKTGCMSIVFMYSCIAIQIYRTNTLINSPDSWSSWHQGRSLQDLFATPQSALESDLLFTIQTRYVHPVNPTDFIYSIVQSSLSLKNEIHLVENQIWRYEWLVKCKALQLFFIDAQDLEDLKERHRKLLFMQHLFASWCARYKIDKNN
jgi:hypothetical protein